MHGLVDSNVVLYDVIYCYIYDVIYYHISHVLYCYIYDVVYCIVIFMSTFVSFKFHVGHKDEVKSGHPKFLRSYRI